MASLFQYRRMRREVQEDLARAQQLERSASTSLSEPKEEQTKEDDSGEDDSKKLTMVPGVTVSRPEESDGSIVFEVGWKENDPSNPLSWTLTMKWFVMFTCCALAIPLTMLASIEGPVQDAFDAHFGVNAMAGSMTTGKTSTSHPTPAPNDTPRHFSYRYRRGLPILRPVLRNVRP